MSTDVSAQAATAPAGRDVRPLTAGPWRVEGVRAPRIGLIRLPGGPAFASGLGYLGNQGPCGNGPRVTGRKAATVVQHQVPAAVTKPRGTNIRNQYTHMTRAAADSGDASGSHPARETA